MADCWCFHAVLVTLFGLEALLVVFSWILRYHELWNNWQPGKCHPSLLLAQWKSCLTTGSTPQGQQIGNKEPNLQRCKTGITLIWKKNRQFLNERKKALQGLFLKGAENLLESAECSILPLNSYDSALASLYCIFTTKCGSLCF